MDFRRSILALRAFSFLSFLFDPITPVTTPANSPNSGLPLTIAVPSPAMVGNPNAPETPPLTFPHTPSFF